MTGVGSVEFFDEMYYGKKRLWKVEKMKKAISAVKDKKMPYRQASKKFEVPKSTLEYFVKQILSGEEVNFTKPMGYFKMTFTIEQENYFLDIIKTLEDQLMPLDQTDFRRLAYQVAERLKVPHKFNSDLKMAGPMFCDHFLKRHTELKLHTPEQPQTPTKKLEEINKFYAKLDELVNRHEFESSEIFIADETNVSACFESLDEQIKQFTPNRQEQLLTILLCVNAAGDEFIPPLIVFAKNQLNEQLIKGSPKDSLLEAEPKGLITKKNLMKWLELFAKRVSPTRNNPALLIVNKHTVLKDLDIIEFNRSHNIYLLGVPNQSIYGLQPLKSVIKKFESELNIAFSRCTNSTNELSLNNKIISYLLDSAYRQICNTELVKTAFKSSKIYSFENRGKN